MTPKDLAQLLRSALETQAFPQGEQYGFKVQYNEDLAVADVCWPVEGTYKHFKVIFKPEGFTDDVLLGF